MQKKSFYFICICVKIQVKKGTRALAELVVYTNGQWWIVCLSNGLFIEDKYNAYRERL